MVGVGDCIERRGVLSGIVCADVVEIQKHFLM